MIRLEGERLPEEARGQVVPVLFGALHKDVIGIPLQVGYAAVLADNCGIQTPDPGAIPPKPTTNPVIEISGPMMETIRKYVPSSGVIQIDSEWLSYAAFLTSPYRLVISGRGLGATDPAMHEKGAQIIFVEAKPLYVFAWSPPGHTYGAGAVVQVRVNDSTQVPFHTIRIQDSRIVPGERLLTVEFDLTRAIIGVPGESNIAAIAGGGPTPEEDAEYQARAQGLRPIAGGAGVLGFTGTGIGRAGAPWRPGQPLQKNKLMGVVPPDMLRAQKPEDARPSAPKAVGTSAGDPRPAPVRLLTLPLGRVTADIRGLQDSPAARLGEGANTVLTHPVPIARLILEETFEQTTRDEPTWTATHARQVGLGITWLFKWYGEPFETFRALAGYCGQADLYVDDAGLWQYRFRERQGTPVATLTPREFVGDLELGWTDYLDLATRLDVTWGDAALEGGSFVLDSVMQGRYDIRQKPLDLPWVATEPAARVIGRYWLSQKDHPRMTATGPVAALLGALTRTDRVVLTTPLVNLYIGRTVPFQIRGTTDRGAERVLSMIESDPLGVEILAYGTLTLARDFGVPAYGTLDATTDVPTLWRAVLPGDAIRW